jgi:hypothetical protein
VRGVGGKERREGSGWKGAAVGEWEGGRPEHVHLPAPEGPITAITSPARSSPDTPRSTCTHGLGESTPRTAPAPRHARWEGW